MKNWTLLAAGLLVAALTAGCGKEESARTAPPANAPAPTGAPADASGPAAGSGTPLTAEQMDAVTRAEKPYKLVLIVKTRNNPFFSPMIDAAQREAKSLGAAIEIQAPQQETDKERQFSIVQDVTARGAQAILVAPADSKGIVPALKQAAEKGVAVINLDNRVDSATAQSAGLQLTGYIGADNAEGGRMAGSAMLQALNGTGKVAVLEGIRGVDNAEARKRGFLEAIQGKLEVATSDTAEWDTQKAYAKFQSMLAAHPDLRGVFCANDKMALGAMKAISEAGKKGKITVIGYDNIPDVKPYLSDGELYATIEQHPDLMGKYGVLLAVGALNGVLPKGREHLVKLELIRGK